jgi:hypothetical protein
MEAGAAGAAWAKAEEMNTGKLLDEFKNNNQRHPERPGAEPGHCIRGGSPPTKPNHPVIKTVIDTAHRPHHPRNNQKFRDKIPQRKARWVYSSINN